jgi:hypothetical protein
VVGSIQAVRADAPGGIALSVAPAPPPNEYPEIRAAVVAAQKEVKAGAKLKFGDLYRLGQVIGTGHYARCVRVRVRACVRVGGGPGGGGGVRLLQQHTQRGAAATARPTPCLGAAVSCNVDALPPTTGCSWRRLSRTAPSTR